MVNKGPSGHKTNACKMRNATITVELLFMMDTGAKEENENIDKSLR
jgi:hypothetical protein